MLCEWFITQLCVANSIFSAQINRLVFHAHTHLDGYIDIIFKPFPTYINGMLYFIVGNSCYRL